MLRGFCSLAILILLSSSIVTAQSPQPAIRPSTPKPPSRVSDDEQENSHLPEEMRVKMAIARAEESHKKILEDVEKLSSLSEEIVKDYGDSKKLSGDDLRKLGTIEKLAKRILNHAGGEEVEDKNDPSEHLALAEAIDMLGSTAANIKKEMTAETRFVVSATVIAMSNEVSTLSRLIRHAK